MLFVSRRRITWLVVIIVNIQLIFCFKYPENFAVQHDSTITDNILEELPILTHVLFRHGDRNIIQPYPNDPYKDEKLWPGGFGALTNIGKQQQFGLGKYLRRRYKDFISERYLPSEVYVRSTDSDRTLMSAQANLAGLYPPSGEQVWKSSLKWQPIPIHSMSMNNDFVLYPITSCPRFDFLLEEYFESPEMAVLLNEHQPLIDYLQKNSGYETILTMTQIMLIYDTLFIERLNGLTLPSWANEAMKFNDTLAYISTLWYEAYTHTTEMKKLECGFLLKEILDRCSAKANSTLQPDRKLWIYSAHDLNIFNILNTVTDFSDPHIPPYASSLYFELYKRNTGHFVELYYQNSTNAEKLEPLEILDCGKSCPLDRLYEIFSNILPTETEDRKTLCRL